MKRIVRLHLFLLQHLPPSACNVLLLLEGEEEEGEGEESLYYTRTSYTLHTNFEKANYRKCAFRGLPASFKDKNYCLRSRSYVQHDRVSSLVVCHTIT